MSLKEEFDIVNSLEQYGATLNDRWQWF